MTSKNFEELKERLRALKTEQREIQTLYEERASQRLEYQNKMANLNLMLQNRSFDTMLIEDVVVVTLVAENNARERYGLMPPAPTKTAIQVEPGQKTKSLEEACNVYKSQIEVLEEMNEFRKTLTATERDLDLLYRQAVDDILDIVEEYCDDEKLKGDMFSFAAGGSAPCSPRKEKKKSVINRIIKSPGSFFSPKKEMIRDSMQNELLPAPLSAEPPETPKQPFAHFKESAQLNELRAAPFIDLSENDDAGGSTNEGEMHETATGQAGVSDPTERRKTKKNSKQPSQVRDDDVEEEPDTKKKKKKIEDVTVQSTTPDVLVSSEPIRGSSLRADAETELIEKKKKKKKAKRDGEASESSGADIMTEAVATGITEKTKEKKNKKKKKHKEGDTSESGSLGGKIDTEHLAGANGEEVIEAFCEMKGKQKKEKSKLKSVNDNLEADLSANGDDGIPTEKKKKKTKNKSKVTEHDESPPLVDESQESPKKKNTKKVKDSEEAEVELASEKTTKKKKTRDKGERSKDAVTTGRKTDL